MGTILIIVTIVLLAGLSYCTYGIPMLIIGLALAIHDMLGGGTPSLSHIEIILGFAIFGLIFAVIRVANELNYGYIDYTYWYNDESQQSGNPQWEDDDNNGDF